MENNQYLGINLHNYERFGESEIYFPKKDIRKIKKMKNKIFLVSTVCPDYPHDGSSYTFNGELGTGISLTAKDHLRNAPKFIDELKKSGLEVHFQILVADLPELTLSQRPFYMSVSGSKEDYIQRCEKSAKEIQDQIKQLATVETFSLFYGKRDLNYLTLQEQTESNILKEVSKDSNSKFAHYFRTFMVQRRVLAERFRRMVLQSEGRYSLTQKEMFESAAHGMSLYMVHGSLLRLLLLKESLIPEDGSLDLIVLNHNTHNIRNFHNYQFVPGCEVLDHFPNFPVGIVGEEH